MFLLLLQVNINNLLLLCIWQHEEPKGAPGFYRSNNLTDDNKLNEGKRVVG